MNIYLENISKNVRERRLRAGLSQDKLAKLIKKTNRFVSTLETNPKDVKLGTLVDISEALSCDLMDLLGPFREKYQVGKRATKESVAPTIPDNVNAGLDFAISLLLQAQKKIPKPNKN